MKKGLLVAASVITLSLAGCSSGLAGTEEEKENAKKPQEEQSSTTASNSNGSLNQIVVIPEKYLSKDGTSSEIDPESVEHVSVESDATKYTFAQDKLLKQRDAIDTEIVAALQDLADGKTLDSVKKVDAYKDFAYIKIQVDRSTFDEAKDPFVFDALAIPIATYQILSGIDEPKAKVEFVDAKTEEVLVTKTIPKDVPVE